MPEAKRCPWCMESELYRRYHDEEWGVPSFDDGHLFEMLILEGAQAGLSWSTILNKRENYRRAYAGFDTGKMARFSPQKIERLLQEPGIVRNRLKVQSARSNAIAFLDICEQYGTFADYIWNFVDGKPIQNRWKRLVQIPASTTESDTMSRDLKKRGFKFVGSTICYAYMQAVGMVNDHLVDCYRYKEVARLAEKI